MSNRCHLVHSPTWKSILCRQSSEVEEVGSCGQITTQVKHNLCRNQENQSSEKDYEGSVDWHYVPSDKIWYRGGDLAQTRKTELFMVATSHARGDSKVIRPLYDYSPRFMIFLAQLYLPKSHVSQAAEVLSIHRLVLAQFPHALGSLTVKYCIGATV